MKSFLSLLLLIPILLFCASCTSDKTTSTTAPIWENGISHYEIDLNMDNFNTFLNYETIDNYTHTISGVLTYAYYDNVVVTFQVKFKDSFRETEWSTMTYTVHLNAAGNAEFDVEDLFPYQSQFYDISSFTIADISGKVIFAI